LFLKIFSKWFIFNPARAVTIKTSRDISSLFVSINSSKLFGFMHNKSTPSSSCPKLDLISCLPLNESTISLFDSYRNKFGPSEIELNPAKKDFPRLPIPTI
jgi:hypothetical protein